MRQSYGLPLSVIDGITNQIEEIMLEVPDHLEGWAKVFQRLITKRKLYEARVKLHETEGISLQSNDKFELSFSEIIHLLCPKFPSWQSKPTTESTYINQNLMPFIKVVFSRDPRFVHALTHKTLTLSSTLSTSLEPSSPSASPAALVTSTAAGESPNKKRKVNKVMPDYLLSYKFNHSGFTIEVKKEDPIIV